MTTLASEKGGPLLIIGKTDKLHRGQRGGLRVVSVDGEPRGAEMSWIGESAGRELSELKENMMADTNKLYNEAEKLKDEGKHEEAIAKLQELLAEDDKHVLSHLALAVVYGRIGQHEKAIEHGRRACEIDPNDPFNFTAMSVTYQRAWQGTQNGEYIQLAEDAMARAHALQ